MNPTLKKMIREGIIKVLLEADPSSHFINQMTGGSDDDEKGQGMHSVQPNTGRTTFADKPVHSLPGKQRLDLAAFRKAREAAKAAIKEKNRVHNLILNELQSKHGVVGDPFARTPGTQNPQAGGKSGIKFRF